MGVTLEATAACNTGFLVVLLVAWSASRQEDLCVGLSEGTGELEVGCAGATEGQKFSLEEHLPSGTEIYFPSEEATEVAVTFYPKTRRLRVRVPWRHA